MSLDLFGNDTCLARGTGRRPLARTIAGLHRCIICGLEKPLSEFYKDRSFHDGYGHRCKQCNVAYKKEYHARILRERGEKIRARRRVYWAENRERVLAVNKASRDRNKHRWNARHREEHRANPIKNMLAMARMRARKKGLAFDLTAADITVPEFCPVLGIPLIVGVGKATINSPSIDRIDNSLGYIKGNVVVVSHKANTIKNSATVAELRMVADFYSGLCE